MIGLIFGDTDFPNKILKTINKRKIKYIIIDLSTSKKFKKDSFVGGIEKKIKSQTIDEILKILPNEFPAIP